MASDCNCRDHATDAVAVLRELTKFMQPLTDVEISKSKKIVLTITAAAVPNRVWAGLLVWMGLVTQWKFANKRFGVGSAADPSGWTNMGGIIFFLQRHCHRTAPLSLIGTCSKLLPKQAVRQHCRDRLAQHFQLINWLAPFQMTLPDCMTLLHVLHK